MTIKVADPLKALNEICEPDERQEFLAQSLEQIHCQLAALTLHKAVPLGVRQLFETAKNARLYTYFVYRFHQVAEMLAYQALERALKERWNTEFVGLSSIDDEHFHAPSLSDLLGMAVSRGWIRNQGFSTRQHRAYMRIMTQRSHAAILAVQTAGAEGTSISEPSEDEVNSEAGHVDVTQLLAEHIPSFRNQLAHGGTNLAPTSDLILTDVCDAIGMIFDGTPPIELTNNEPPTPPGLHGIFKTHLRELEAKRRALIAMRATTRDSLPDNMPERGVYLFSERGAHLYVGRSNKIRRRVCLHCRPKAKHNMASFAFLLAKEKTGVGRATYRKGLSRSVSGNQPACLITQADRASQSASDCPRSAASRAAA